MLRIFSHHSLYITRLYNFLKNNAQSTFSYIISLHTNPYEREQPCTLDLLYNENNLIGKLYRYFHVYFMIFSTPTIETLFLLILFVKNDLICLVDEYENLDLIGNARADSVIYGLAPEPTRKKGRPAVHGRKLSIQDDFIL